MIRFGSRTDCLHAARHRPCTCSPGDRVIGGVTVLGSLAMIRRRHPRTTRRAGTGTGLREKRSRSIFLLPSLLTTGNLFCGFLALLLTVQGRYTDAAIAIFVAMVMDLLDGRVARLMKATSQFGVEYDSLADVVSFGVAPAFLMYSFALAKLGRPAWFAAFLFAICGALRLARFNVLHRRRDKRYFTGLLDPGRRGRASPRPSSSLHSLGVEPARVVLVVMAIGTYLVALLMVSTFKYWSFKEVGLGAPPARPRRCSSSSSA